MNDTDLTPTQNEVLEAFRDGAEAWRPEWQSHYRLVGKNRFPRSLTAGMVATLLGHGLIEWYKPRGGIKRLRAKRA